MAEEYVIRNARLRGDRSAHADEAGSDRAASEAALFDIHIRGDRIAAIEPAGGAGPSGDIDAAGRLVTEPFVNGHLHLDKVYTLERIGSEALEAYHGEGMGGAMTAIELASAVKQDYDAAWIVPNVRRAVERAIAYGNTHIRAFADVDTTGKLEGVKAVLQVRDELRDRCTIEVVAFPQDGVIRDDGGEGPGAEDYVREALEMGADIVGGIPWIELTDLDAQEHVDRMFDLALEFDRDVSMLVDDAGDPNLWTTEMLASKALEMGWEGRVSAQHARAMALYPEPTFRRLVGLLKKAGVSVVSDPHTGPLHARVRDLRAAGVPVALGQDDCADAYYPFGRNNMLEVGFLASHLLWMTSFEDLEAIYDMLTVDAARALGISDYGLRVGGPADCIVLREASVWEALWEHDAPALVVRGGRVVGGTDSHGSV